MLCALFTGFTQSITTVEGFAPTYVGEKVEIFAFEDYVTRVKDKLAETEVKEDSTFELTFYNEITRKLRVDIGDNHFLMYAQPKSDYKVYVKGFSPYLSKEARKVEVEFFFIDLDSTDINYKILMFEDRQLSFLKENYKRSSMDTPEFVAALDTFKLRCTNDYEEDTSRYFKNYVRYSFASLDNLAYKGNRNRFEKYDFYIKPQTVLYQNDRYMDYILKYYDNYSFQLSNDLNQEFYDGIIQASPTLVMNALGKDYALDNIRLREVVMLKMLGDVFYSDDYPQTNILTMLDSISENALFEKNKSIASNLKYRLLELVPGAEMPDFVFNVDGEKKGKNDFEGKHLYIQFVRKDAEKSERDLPLVKPLFTKYGKYTDFLTVVVVEEEDELLESPDEFIKEHNISWNIAVVDENDPILDRLGIAAFPQYILMDAAGYVVQAPALTPRPNNEYETIEKVLFNIHKRRKALENRGN
tara:strand:- start:25190 stop:26602 length:1413 start_codon:yes stop_codon:yes gene_type:complete